MREIPATKFKAIALSVLAQVQKSGTPVVITRYGRPVAEIVPPKPSASPKSWLGSMRGAFEIVGDIVAPSSELAHWDALED